MFSDDWFTVEQIDSKTYVISEYKHYEKTHCYLILGSQRAALIDTGLGICNIHKVVERITTLPILVITTHAHWDHIGGHRYFKNFAVHEKDLTWIQNEFPLSLEVVKFELLKYKCAFPNSFNIKNYRLFKGTPSVILKDNYLINLGNRILRIIHTPGHSPGHICVFEEQTGYLFTGDLVYKGKLNISYESTNPIEYMESIEKLSKLNASKIFPGHFDLNVETSMIFYILQALKSISLENKLKHGEGVFTFKDFEICF